MMHQIEENVKSNDPSFFYLNLRPHEEIKMIVRHHWAGFLPTLLLSFLMISLLLGFMGYLIYYSEGFRDAIKYYWVGVSAFTLFWLTFLLASWTNYYYDIVFITNERVINVEQVGLLARRSSELNMRQIQNVSAEVSGFLKSVFNFGLLVIETAAEGTAEKRPAGLEGYFTLEDIPDPNRVGRLIIELHRKAIGDEG